MKYRWTSKKPLARPNPSLQGKILLPGSHVETNYVREGDVFTPTAQELASFGDRIEEVEEKKK